MRCACPAGTLCHGKCGPLPRRGAAALSRLQILRQDVLLVDDPRLQDGLHQAWPADAVAEHVAAAVQRLQPGEVSGACHGRAGTCRTA